MIFFVVVHAVQAIQFRLWLLLPTAVVCGILEIIGWGGRLWSSQNPYLRTPFLMQCVLIVAAWLYRRSYTDHEDETGFRRLSWHRPTSLLQTLSS